MADEAEWQRRLQAHDPDALAEFLRQHEAPLLVYVQRQLSDSLRAKVAAQDILQDAAIAALSALPKTDFSDRSPFGWLCQIAQQRIIDASRRLYAQKRGANRDVALHGPAGDGSHDWVSQLAASITSPSHACTRAERHAALERAIGMLPPDVQQVLRWRYVEDLPTKEIAARLGKSDGAVRVLLSRTVQKLQELLQEE